MNNTAGEYIYGQEQKNYHRHAAEKVIPFTVIIGYNLGGNN